MSDHIFDDDETAARLGASLAPVEPSARVRDALLAAIEEVEQERRTVAPEVAAAEDGPGAGPRLVRTAAPPAAGAGSAAGPGSGGAAGLRRCRDRRATRQPAGPPHGGRADLRGWWRAWVWSPSSSEEGRGSNPAVPVDNRGASGPPPPAQVPVCADGKECRPLHTCRASLPSTAFLTDRLLHVWRQGGAEGRVGGGSIGSGRAARGIEGGVRAVV